MWTALLGYGPMRCPRCARLWPVSMVTIAVAKRPGADATQIGRALEARIHELDGVVLTDDIDLAITRNYGETAREKVVTLQEHLAMAVLAVGLVVALSMGWRAAVVVMTAVPITFAPMAAGIRVRSIAPGTCRSQPRATRPRR